MLVPEMAVGLGNQNPAIAMALPRREGLEVNAFLDGPGDEASPERTGREMRELEAPACSREGLLGISHSKHRLSNLNAPARFQLFQEGQKLRKDRNRIARVGLGAIERDPLRIEVDVLTPQIRAFRGSNAGEAHELN